MSIKINAIIESMEDYLESKNRVLGSNKILVDKKQLLDYILDIRNEMPKSVADADLVYKDRKFIIQDAKIRSEETIEASKQAADQIIAEANAKREELISEHEITKNAEVKASDIILSAKEEAFDIIEEAKRESEIMRNETFDFVEDKINKLDNTFAHAKYNTDYLRDEFNKHASSLFHILLSNIEKEQEAVVENKKAFAEYRDKLKKSKLNEVNISEKETSEFEEEA